MTTEANTDQYEATAYASSHDQQESSLMVGDLGLTGIGLVCCLACVFILPCFIWLIWGGIILDNAHGDELLSELRVTQALGLGSEGTCRADQFWCKMIRQSAC